MSNDKHSLATVRLHVTPFLHGNVQYAEFDPAQVPEIVEESYLPALEYFAEHPQLPGVFEYSGISLEVMAEGWPRTIELLRLLLGRGQIELLGSTYANPILPLIPTDHARRHLARFWQVYDRLFGDLDVPRPRGIFLQEFAYDAALAPLLRESGYEYTILTPRLLLAGLRRQLNTALKPGLQERPKLLDHADELLHPVRLSGAQGAYLTAIPLYRELIDAMFGYAYGRRSFEQIEQFLEQVAAHCAEQPAFLFLGPSDAEFIGVYERLGREALSMANVGELLLRLDELPFVELVLPRTYLDAHAPQQTVYVPAGSSEHALALWTDDTDNVRLDLLCAEATRKLELAQLLCPEQKALLEEAWQAMLLAENSDGRGWMPRPERRLACYNQALRAIALAEEALSGVGKRRAMAVDTPDGAQLLDDSTVIPRW